MSDKYIHLDSFGIVVMHLFTIVRLALSFDSKYSKIKLDGKKFYWSKFFCPSMLARWIGHYAAAWGFLIIIPMVILFCGGHEFIKDYKVFIDVLAPLPVGLFAYDVIRFFQKLKRKKLRELEG